MDIGSLVFIGIAGLVVYIFLGCTTSMVIDECITSADEFDCSMCGVFWPVTLIIWVLMLWPYKCIAYFYKIAQAKIKKLKKRKVSIPVREVK